MHDHHRTHAPGTLEKLRVLEERAVANIALHHPYDAHYEGDDRPWRWFQREVRFHKMPLLVERQRCDVLQGHHPR